jgi:type I restriction enzyme S subunit
MAGEWIDTTVGQQATLQRGIDITKAEQRSGAVPVISSGGVSSYHDTSAASGPGVILGRKGVVGSVYFVASDYWPHDTTLWVKDFHGNDPRFVYYFFRWMAPRIATMDVGSANPTLNRNHVHPIEISWPSRVEEQRAIAHILGTLDDKIELNRQMNETLEATARALFKSWFVDFDPVRAKTEDRNPGLPKPLADLFPDSFGDSELGEIPRGWEARSLYETAGFINGAAFKSGDFCDPSQGLPIVKITELKDGISAQTKFSDRAFDPKQLIDTGELLYSWSGSPDTSLDAFLWTKGRGLLNQHIFKVVTPTIAEKRFVYYLLKFLRPTLVEIARNKQTTGLGHVTIADMKRLYVCSPSLRVLAAFDCQVAPFFDRAFKNTIQNQTAATLRDTLLPKLISGELRVTHPKILAEVLR